MQTERFFLQRDIFKAGLAELGREKVGQAGGAHAVGNIPLLLSSPDGISAPASHRAWPIRFIKGTNGGEAGIRTLGTPKCSTVFETAPFDRSGTSPKVLIRSEFVYLAEEERFELSVPCGTHDFQSCRLSHSRTPPPEAARNIAPVFPKSNARRPYFPTQVCC